VFSQRYLPGSYSPGLLDTPPKISSVEELFEYYFLLTYKDGTVVDVPAGVTAFVPASTAEQYERANSLPSVARPVHLSVPRVGDRPSAAPKETPDCVGVEVDERELGIILTVSCVTGRTKD
jgi:hypothetical protein